MGEVFRREKNKQKQEDTAPAIYKHKWDSKLKTEWITASINDHSSHLSTYYVSGTILTAWQSAEQTGQLQSMELGLKNQLCHQLGTWATCNFSVPWLPHPQSADRRDRGRNKGATSQAHRVLPKRELLLVWALALGRQG